MFSFLKRKKELSYPSNGHDFWYSLIQSQATKGIAAVYACELAIKESIAMLPAVVMNENEDGKFPDKEDYLFNLIKYQPNKMMSSFDFFEAQQTSLLEYGNAYSLLRRSKIGEVKEILPLDPANMTVEVLPGNRLGYLYSNNGKKIEYDSSKILHVKYNTKDGILGRSPRDECPGVFELAKSLQDHGNRIFEHGAFMSGFLELPPEFKFRDDEQRSLFLESFNKYLGSENYNKFALLEGGAKFNNFVTNNRDSQFIELNQFQVTNIARIYRMPPVMLGVTESGMSYASIEQLGIMFVTYTVQPWATRWEQALKWQVFGKDSPQFLKFNMKSLLRGDLKAQTEAIAIQIQNGLKTINEARDLNDDNPSKDPLASELLVSHNLLQGILKDGQKQTDPTN